MQDAPPGRHTLALALGLWPQASLWWRHRAPPRIRPDKRFTLRVLEAPRRLRSAIDASGVVARVFVEPVAPPGIAGRRAATSGRSQRRLAVAAPDVSQIGIDGVKGRGAGAASGLRACLTRVGQKGRSAHCQRDACRQHEQHSPHGLGPHFVGRVPRPWPLRRGADPASTTPRPARAKDAGRSQRETTQGVAPTSRAGGSSRSGRTRRCPPSRAGIACTAR